MPRHWLRPRDCTNPRRGVFLAAISLLLVPAFAAACADPGAITSGIGTNTVPNVHVTTDIGSITSTGACVDNAGNSANQLTVSGLRLDKTAPTCTIQLTPPYRPDGTMKGVSVKVSAADTGGSDVASNSIRLVSITPSGASAAESGWDEGAFDTSGNVRTATGTTYVWVYSVRDGAGNTGTCLASMTF